jgi:histidyl-tRNA synthetase
MLGPEELKKKIFVLKNMETGEQSEYPIDKMGKVLEVLD